MPDDYPVGTASNETSYSKDVNINLGPTGGDVNIGFNKNQMDAPLTAAAKFLTYGPIGAMLGAADTIYTGFGGDQETIENLAKVAIPSFGDYYSNNKQVMQTVGDLAAMFVPMTLGAKAIEGGGIVAKAVTAEGRLPYLENIFTSGKDLQQLLAGVNARSEFMATVEGQRMWTNDALFRAAKSQFYRTTAVDALKQYAAGETATFALLHNSETLYPSEMDAMQWAEMHAFGLIPAVGLPMAFARRQIGRAIAQTAPKAAETRNPAKLADEFLTADTRDRSVLLTNYSLRRKAADYIINDPTSNEQLVRGLNADKQQYLGTMQDQLQDLGNQTQIYGVRGLTSKFDFDQGHWKTADIASQKSPEIFVGLDGVDRLPPTMQERLAFEQKRGSKLDDLTEQINAGLKKNNELALKSIDDPDKYNPLIKTNNENLLALQLQRDKLKGMEFGVMEPDGTITPLMARKPRATDGDMGFTFETIPATTTETKKYVARNVTDSIFGTQSTSLAMDGEGNLLVSRVNTTSPAEQVNKILQDLQKQIEGSYTVTGAPMVQQTIMGQRVMQTLSEADLNNPALKSYNLFDIGQSYHYQTGQFGKPIYRSLPSNIQSAIDSWSGTAQNNPIRKWFATNAPEAQILYDAFAPLRLRLDELADADGTILLYRGQSKEETKDILAGRGNDVVSYTSNYNIAHKNFGAGRGPGRDTIVVRVPVDDVIMVHGGIKEWEFIVKNHRTRILGDAVNPATPITNVAGIAGPTTISSLPGYGKIQQLNLGTHVLPTSNWDELGYMERSVAFRLMQKYVDNFDPAKDRFIVSHNMPWYKYDMMEQLLLKDNVGPAQIGKSLIFPMERPSAPAVLNGAPFHQMSEMSWTQWKNLQGKYLDYAKLQSLQTALHEGTIANPELKKLNPYDFQHLLNMPGTSTGQQGYALKIFDQMYRQGMPNLESGVASLDHFNRFVQQSMQFDAKIQSIQDLTSRPVLAKIRGDNLTYPEGAKPFVVMKSPLKAEDYTRNAQELKMMQSYETRTVFLRNANKQGGDLVSLITQTMDAQPTLTVMRDVDSLAPGMTPGNQMVGQAKWTNRWSPTLSEMFNNTVMTSRIGRKWIENLFKQEFDPANRPGVSVNTAFNMLLTPSKSSELKAFTAWMQSRRFGWELVKDEEPLENGLFGFKMADTEFNKRMFAKQFPGVEWQDKQMLMPSAVASEYKPAVITQEGLDAAKAYRFVGGKARDNVNAIHRSVGRGEIAYKEWWVPPPDLSRKRVAYLINGAGDVQVIAGNTPAELEEYIRKEVVANRALRGHIIEGDIEHGAYNPLIVDRKTLEQHFDVIDKVNSGMANFADISAQTGRSRGSTGSHVLELGSQMMRDAIGSVTNQFLATVRRTRAVYFSPQIDRAMLYHNTTPQTKGLISGKEASIWQRYVDTIYERQALKPSTTIGQITAETYLVDDLLKDLWELPTIKRARTAISETGSSRGYEGLQKTLGEYNPFTDTMDYVERTLRVTAPPTIKGLMGQLSNFATTAFLRFLDVGTSVSNALGLVATMPAVVRALNPLPGETRAEQAARTGMYGLMSIKYNLGGGNTLETTIMPVLHPGKVMTHTAWDFFQPHGQQVMQKATQMGLIDQDVAEWVRAFVSPQRNYYQQIATKAIDMMSVLTDKSENLSRAFAFLAGHNIAEKLIGYDNELARFGFANHFADMVIGNYSAFNRPQSFQGAAGMPLGLFQTWIWNYYQRMFSWMENKQYASLATLYGMQASIFGMKSVPGWSAFTQHFATANEHSTNSFSPVDVMRNRLGDAATDFLMYGALSTISGMGFTTRGNVDLLPNQVPTILTPENSAAWKTGEQFWDLISNTVGMFQRGGHYSNQQMAEILSLYGMNRPFKALMESLAGVTVDEHGQVVNDQVNTGLEIAARFMGVRSLQEMKSREAYFMDRSGQFSQEAKMERLERSLRSSIRAGDWDGVNQSIYDYMKYGGSPQGIGRVVRNNVLAATLDRNERELIHQFRNPNNLADILRYTHMGIRPSIDAELSSQEEPPEGMLK